MKKKDYKINFLYSDEIIDINNIFIDVLNVELNKYLYGKI